MRPRYWIRVTSGFSSDDSVVEKVVSGVFEEDRRSQTRCANINLRGRTVCPVVGGSQQGGRREMSREIRRRRYRTVSMILGVALTGDISHWAGLRWRRTRRDAHTEVMEVFEL